jgi:ATP:ADP antiporter, AAA family
LRRALARIFSLQPGDGRLGALLFSYLFVVITCYQMGKAARDALFLSVFKASKLPYADMAIALTVGLVFALYVTIGRRVSVRNLVAGSLLLFAAVCCGFWFLAVAHPEQSWQFPAFYLWVGILGVLAPTQVWTLANYLLTTRQAKRVFGLVGAGGISGWIFAGMLTKVLASVEGLGTESLLLAMAIGFTVCAGIVVALWRLRGSGDSESTSARDAPSKNLRESLGVIFSSPYLISIASLITLSSVATTFAGWQFKAIAKAAYADKDALTAFFGEFNFWAGIACLVLQLLLTSRFLRRFGLGPALLVVPLALFFSEIAVFVFGTLATVILLKGSDQLLRYSLDKSSVELLYLPIPPEVKLQAKSCIDTFIWRLGDGVAGFTLAIFTDQLNWSAQRVSVINFVFLGAWITAALLARRQYAARLLDSIRQRRLDAERQLTPVLDRSANEMLAAQLQSNDPKEVLYALELFGVSQRPAPPPHPAVRDLLAHENAAVRKAAVEALDEAADRWALPRIEELLRDDDLGVRTAALLFLAHHAQIDPLTRIEGLGDFPAYSIESGMAAFLAQPGTTQNLVAARLLVDKMIDQRGEAGKSARLEAAELLAILPDAFDAQLDRLLDDDEPEVVRAAMAAAAKRGKRRLAPKLIERLGDGRVREEAAQALVDMGDRVVGALRDALNDAHADPGARLEIPGVLARIGSRAAAHALVENLLVGEPEVRFRIISALNELQRDRPQIALDRKLLHASLALEMMLHCRTNQILAVVAGERESGERPPSAVRERLETASEIEIERIFRLLSLLHPSIDFHSAHFGVRSSDPVARDNAVEFLDLTLEPELRKTLVPLLDPGTALEERIAPILRHTGMDVPTRHELIGAMVESADPWLKACGISAIGSLSLTELAAEVDTCLDSEDELLREAAHAAKRRLAEVPATD